jgi:hypothetical protein
MLSSHAGLDYCEGVITTSVGPSLEREFRPEVAPALMLGLLGIIATGLAACSSTSSCSQHPCPRDLQLTIKSATWQAGNYRLDIVYDAVHLVCDIAIPVPSTSGLSTNDDDDAGAKPEYCEVLSGSPGQVDLELGSTLFVRLGDLPEALHVTIHRDANLLADRNFTPTYNVFHANGGECGECKVAAEAISIP